MSDLPRSPRFAIPILGDYRRLLLFFPPEVFHNPKGGSMDTQKPWVDFRLVKARVSMTEVLTHYGINWLRKSGSELRGKCPIHQGEGERSFHVNVSKNAF